MLLENIFWSSMLVFLLMIAFILLMEKFASKHYYQYGSAIIALYLISGASTIITAIWWIVRAWG